MDAPAKRALTEIEARKIVNYINRYYDDWQKPVMISYVYRHFCHIFRNANVTSVEGMIEHHKLGVVIFAPHGGTYVFPETFRDRYSRPILLDIVLQLDMEQEERRNANRRLKLKEYHRNKKKAKRKANAEPEQQSEN